jgi:hypothetical protein
VPTLDKKKYVVREVPYMRGSHRRVLDRCTYLHEAMQLAEAVSHEGRCVIVELRGQQMAIWLNGQLQTH